MLLRKLKYLEKHLTRQDDLNILFYTLEIFHLYDLKNIQAADPMQKS